MSRVLLGCVVLAALFVSGCGEEEPEAREGNEIASEAADGATKTQAQALLDVAEKDLLVRPSAEYEVTWLDGDSQQTILTGAFDIGTPAYLQTWATPEATLAYRATAGHAWSQISGEQIAAELDGCWMHFTTGTGDQGVAAAVPPTALMLLEPTAVGFLDGDDSSVVVELLLDEAAPTMMPKIVNQLDEPIDPSATVPGLVTITDGRYAAVEFKASDVFAGLDVGQLPPEAAAVKDMAETLVIRVDYRGFGAKVVVEPPDAREVIEVGSQADLLANGPDSQLDTCAANR